jgi:hypothetical protein
VQESLCFEELTWQHRESQGVKTIVWDWVLRLFSMHLPNFERVSAESRTGQSDITFAPRVDGTWPCELCSR